MLCNSGLLLSRLYFKGFKKCMLSCGAPAAPESVGLLQKCIPLPGSTPPERGFGGAHLSAHRQVIRVTPMEASGCMKCVQAPWQAERGTCKLLTWVWQV